MIINYAHSEELAHAKGYRVDQDGNVFSFSGKQIKAMDSKGYKRFKVCHLGKKIWVLVHRLSAFQKYGSRLHEAGIEVRHVNGNPSDNRIHNIQIGTHSENQMDKTESIRVATSSHQKHDHLAVIDFYKRVKSYKKTMREFGISSTATVAFIVKRALASRDGMESSRRAELVKSGSLEVKPIKKNKKTASQLTLI